MRPQEIQNLPARAGVYLFRDAAGEVLYVGKAKSLKDRVPGYFRGDPGSVKTRNLVSRVDSLETIVVGSEAEALILEANLIKEHRPRFNIQLRDDKRYPYIKVTVQEPFPRVLVTRRVTNDGARYFGPYTSVGPMRQALRVVKRLFTVRSCKYDLPEEAPDRPCLDHHIGQCEAPCVGLQDREDYRGMIDEILEILGGDVEEIRERVVERMHEASEALEYEQAAHYRDVLDGLDTLAREQRVQTVGGGDRDVLGLARDGELAYGVQLRIRDGVLLGRESQRFGDAGDEDESALLSALAARFYLGGGEAALADLPREILVPGDFEDRELFEDVLSEEAGRKVSLRIPRRGEKLRLLELAGDNARHLVEERVQASGAYGDRADAALYDLQERLDLKVVPRLIVCFDVSHTQGSETVASAVVFEHGEALKAGYRRMRIRGEWGNDDVRSIGEVVERYFRRRREEEDEALPELALIDGGKAQLNAALAALGRLGLDDVHVAALAKREEEVYLPGRREPLRLGPRSRALHLLQRIRDEAHRFAVSYNRKLRRRRTIRSELEEIPGIGPKRQTTLLKRFGSVRAIREASSDELARIPGFSDTLARRVREYLK